MNKILVYLLCFAIFLPIGCRKDDVKDDQTPDLPIVETNYVKNVLGVVESKKGEPISGVVVSLGEEEVISNEDGIFELKSVQVSDYTGDFIAAKHADFFYSGVRLYANSLSSGFVKIVLIEKELSARFESDEDVSISLPDGGRLKFRKNSIADNGTPYTGSVYLYTTFIDPSEDGFMTFAPGDLTGVNADNERGVLTSYGMLGVEMIGDQGQELNLLDGEESEVVIKVPDDLLGSAPESIPLWHFDEETNVWEEEGIAELQNGYYIGRVSHFSWWNCDDFNEGVTLCISIDNVGRNAYLENLKVELESGIYGVACGYLDENGQLCGLVPAGEILTLTIYNVCGDILFQGNIGPFTDPMSSVSVPINYSDTYEFEFTGQALECQTMTGLDSAWIKIKADGFDHYTTTDGNGNYEAFMLLCDEEVDYSVLAMDVETASSGYATGMAVSGQDNNLDIVLCEEAAFITLIYDGTAYNSFDCIAKVKPNETIIFGDELQLLLGFDGQTANDFPVTVLGNNFSLDPDVSTVTITQFGPVGSTIKGSFLGMTPFGSQVEGTFVALREE